MVYHPARELIMKQGISNEARDITMKQRLLNFRKAEKCCLFAQQFQASKLRYLVVLEILSENNACKRLC